MVGSKTGASKEQMLNRNPWEHHQDSAKKLVSVAKIVLRILEVVQSEDGSRQPQVLDWDVKNRQDRRIGG